MNRPGPTRTEILVEGLHNSFGDKHVLRGVDLRVEANQIVAIVGWSGSGKTVLLEHMIGHYRATRGRVMVSNHEQPGVPLIDLAELDDERMDQLRRHWAVVFQPNALLSGTVRYNLSLYLREVVRTPEPEIVRRIDAAIRAVGLDPDSVLDKDRDELSGGMAKRVAVARAIVMDPTLIFYDEPTAGLDPTHAGRIHDLIHRMHHDGNGDGRAPGTGPGRTSVIITHDTELLRRVEPRVLLLHEGRIQHDGDYDSFRRSTSPVIRPYVEMMPALQRQAQATG